MILVKKNFRLVTLITSFLFISIFIIQTVKASPGDVLRVSTDINGNQANTNTSTMVHGISADGDKILFSSNATNLVPGDSNNKLDIFLKDKNTGDIQRVNTSSLGEQANNQTEGGASLSKDGRYVVFSSSADNLVPNDTNNNYDVFRKDILSGNTQLISVGNAGNQANSHSFNSDMSIAGDGNYIVFSSYATNLIGDDTNGSSDVFLRDIALGMTTRLSETSVGTEGNNQSSGPKISCDGLSVYFYSNASNLTSEDANGSTPDIFLKDIKQGDISNITSGSNGGSNLGQISCNGDVVFYSGATNLVPGDTNNVYDVFLYKKSDSTTERISIGSGGAQGNDESFLPSVSDDGRYISFASAATNLVSSDTNGKEDIFLYDRATQQTFLRSTDLSGNQSNSDSTNTPYISSNGRFITYQSFASNIVPNDTNNSADIFLIELEFDGLSPVVSGIPDRPSNANGWYNKDVLIDWLSSDPAPSSGIPTDPLDVLASTEGADVTYTSEQSCDPSGNCATGSLQLSIDKTSPNIMASVLPAPNSEGWNNSNVTVSYACSDGLSGIGVCPSPSSVTSDGASQAITATATDLADNSSAAVSTVNIDRTPPVINSLHLSRMFMLFFQPITINADVSDNLSGISSQNPGEFFVDNDPGVGNATPMNYSNGTLIATVTQNPGRGLHLVQVRTQDKAGNWSPNRTAYMFVLLF